MIFALFIAVFLRSYLLWFICFHGIFFSITFYHEFALVYVFHAIADTLYVVWNSFASSQCFHCHRNKFPPSPCFHTNVISPCFLYTIIGGNSFLSTSASPLTWILIPTPAGTHPSPSAASSATFAANPEQCMGSTYVGAGRRRFARKSTVGGIRLASSGPPRCRPPITYKRQETQYNANPNFSVKVITHQMNRSLKNLDGVCYDIHYPRMRAPGVKTFYPDKFSLLLQWRFVARTR